MAESPGRVTALQALFPGTKLDPSRLRRFLRARNGNVKAAAAMVLRDIEWRASRPIPPPLSSFVNRLVKKKAYFHRTAKSGMPLGISIPGRHDKAEPVEENVDFAIFMMELAIHSMRSGVEEVMLLIDLDAFGWHSVDFPFIHQAVQILQNHYPERLGVVCLLDPPLIARTVWNLVAPLLDEKTRSKFRLLKGDYQRSLLQLVDPECLPERYGGTSTYSYDPDDADHPFGLI